MTTNNGAGGLVELPEPVGYQSRQKNALSVGATYRSKQEAAECNLHDDEIDELIPLYTEQQMLAALARQQSRAVDEVLKLAEQMDRDSAQCRRDGYFDAAVIKSDCANRIRAALEGDRDGR